MLVSCLTDSSTLQMEVLYFSKTSVYFQQTTRRSIPEYGTELFVSSEVQKHKNDLEKDVTGLYNEDGLEERLGFHKPNSSLLHVHCVPQTNFYMLSYQMFIFSLASNKLNLQGDGSDSPLYLTQNLRNQLQAEGNNHMWT
jgi:hypothetical protein